MKVTCSECSHPATIGDPAPIETPDGPQRPRIVWECNCHAGIDTEDGCDCRATNVIEGHDGELGEGALNPAASALSDEQLAEAATRRLGMTHAIDAGGSMAPKGKATT